MRIESLLMNMDNSISSRSKIAGILAQDPEYLNECIEVIVWHNDDFSLKCLMAIEMLSRNNFQLLKPYSSQFILSGKLFSDSSSRRCLAKIYGLIIGDHRSKNSEFELTRNLKQELLELNFKWLLSEEKVAVKVFSMQNIYDLRYEEDWIGTELKGILEKEILKSSAGYKSRAIKILRKLNE